MGKAEAWVIGVVVLRYLESPLFQRPLKKVAEGTPPVQRLEAFGPTQGKLDS